jgi:hypothetical protein
MAKRFNSSLTSGNADTLVAGSSINGASLFLGVDAEKVKNLSATLNLDIETTSLTLAAKWQVSNDASTWYDLAHGSQNAAAVVLGTGTGGADAAITKAIPAPSAVYGYRFARIALVTAGATGAATDTYAIGYSYNQV